MEVTWTCLNTQERTDALEMKKCVFENLKGDFFFFLMHLSSCLLLFEAINNQNFPVSSALLLSLISLSLFSSFQIISPFVSRDLHSNHESWKTGHHLDEDEAARERRSGKKKKLKLSKLMTQTSLDAC